MAINVILFLNMFFTKYGFYEGYHEVWILRVMVDAKILGGVGKLCMFLSSTDFFFKINFLEKIFQEYHPSVKQFGPWV